MLRPSIVGSVGTVPPASATNVGSQSMFPATASHVAPAGTRPGHHAIVGTRTPPSKVEPLPPRSGPASPPSLPLLSQGPLSLEKRTSVLPSSFSSRSSSSTRPTLQSSSSTQSPYRPFFDLSRNRSPG